jgi:hypothetical protein
MYYRLYKSRLLTAHHDGADWRAWLDEGYVTKRHATPEAALDDAIRWLEGQGAALGERLARGLPDLTVNLYIYPTEAGGRDGPIGLGWGCPCSRDKILQEGWDGYPLLESEMSPGERRRLGFVFSSGAEAVHVLRPAGRFYLWEGRFIGEAEIVP